MIFFFQRFADKEELLRNMMGLMVSTEFSQRRRKYILSNHYCVYDFLEILLFSNDLLVNFFSLKGNIAEVRELRKKLMEGDFMDIFW